MWRLAAILYFFLAVIRYVESGPSGELLQQPLLGSPPHSPQRDQAFSIQATSAPNWMPLKRKARPRLIKLEVKYYEFLNKEEKKVEHHEINPGIQVKVITNIAGTKLVGLLGYMGHVCSFVIWNQQEAKYKKVEVVLTGDVARITREVDDNYNPLQEFIDQKKDWDIYIREAIIPKAVTPGSPRSPVSPRAPGSPVTEGHL